jgi:hypothetical protein
MMSIHPIKNIFMEKSPPQPVDGFRLFAKVEKLRGDENGSLTLLTGMMVFLVTIFGVIAFDTNMAIHNRIVAQNAVDSAAESAALWQARGCNMLQQLNNLHYTVDEAACIAEGVAAGACIAAAALLVAELAADAFFGAGEATIRPIRMGVCQACDLLPLIDVGQQLFYKAIMPVEQAIVDVTPFLAFGYANANAYGSGADPLLATVSDYIAGVGTAVGQAIPALQSVSSIISGIGGAISSALGSIPIYAAPLDPTSLELYVKKRDNDSKPPLYWPAAVGIAGEVAGYAACTDAIPFDFEEANSAADELSWDDSYGWNDQYFFGWPGFMTWIAGKDKKDELLGLGNLTWLNGGQNGSTNMYTGSATGGSGSAGVLQIPAFVALASSQIQGTPVIMHGDVDAVSTLIKVYMPGSSPTSAEKFFIYH